MVLVLKDVNIQRLRMKGIEALFGKVGTGRIDNIIEALNFSKLYIIHT
jgi:hypothetical protein